MADLKSLTPTETLDILGKVCPYSLLLTKKAAEKLGNGELLKVLCNHRPAAESTILRYCEMQGFEHEIVRVEDKDYWEIYIRKP